MSELSHKKLIIAALRIALFLFSSVAVLCYGSLMGRQSVVWFPHLIVIVAIANSFSVVLLGWIYSQLWRTLTDCQESEDALQQSQERFHTAVDNFPYTFVIYDADRRIQFVNHIGIEISGYEEPALLGHRDDELFPPDVTDTYLPILQKAVETRKQQTGECTITLPSGQYTIVVNYVPLLNERGEIDQILGITHDITERKRAEQQRDRFFNLSLDMLVIGNMQGYFTHLNPAWERILGFTLDELKAQPFIALVHPDDVRVTQAAMAKLGAGVCVTQLENRYRCKDGSYKWLSWTAVPFLEEGLTYGIAREISDKKQAEAALLQANEDLEIRVVQRTAQLRQREQQLRMMAANIPGSIYRAVFHADGRISLPYISMGWRELTGLDPDETMAHPERLFETLHPDDRDRFYELKRAAIATIETYCHEYRVMTTAGEVKWVRDIGRFSRDDNGNLMVDAVALDNSDVHHELHLRQHVEEELRESQRLIQNIANTTPTLLYIYDLCQDCNVYANRQCEEFFGLTQAEIQARGSQFLAEFLHTEDARQLVAFQQRWATAKEAEVVEKEYRLKNSRGEWRWFYCREVVFTTNPESAPEQVLGTAIDVTERKQLEAELTASEQRFRTSIENMLDCFGIYKAVRDQSGQIVDFLIEYVNAAACSNNCMTKEEQIGKRLCELLPAHRETGLFQEYVKVVETGQPLVKESVAYEDTYNGQHLNRVFDIRAVKLGDGFALSWRDITEHKQDEEARRKTEQLYRTLASNFPNGVVALFDNELRYTLAEGQGLAEVGLSKESLEGKTLTEIFPPNVCAIKEQAYRAALVGHFNRCEFSFADRIYVMHTLPLRNEQGEIYAGMSMSQDISDRKRAELALLEERNFVSAILDTANALIVVLDEQGRIVRFNRACEQITGYSFDDVKERYFWDILLLPEEVEPVKAVFQKLQAGQFPNKYENYWVSRDGSSRLISWSNTVLLDADGLVKYIIGIGIDITDRQQAEETQRALEREQELSELRLRFFSLVSHEFRTPLSTILLTAQILESSAQGWSEEKRKRNLQRIVLAVKEMRQMLDDILTINRAETGKLEFEPVRIDLNSFCQKLLEEMRFYANSEHQLTFSKQGRTRWAFFDEKILGYILTKLIVNAIKYSPQGGEIQLNFKVSKKAIIFQVFDKGIGITLPDQPHVFEAFYRGENIGSIPGSGLGLTVVKKCLELHNGSISLTSEIEVGTTFTVTIPLNQT